jgi:hypothetical protein
MSKPLQIGLLVFPRVTQLDLTGPVQVFSSLPDAKLHLVWKRIEPVPSDSVITLTPTITFADCPQLDVICVPGGYGTDELLLDKDVLEFLQRQEPKAVHNVRLHRFAGAGRCRTVEGLSRRDALDRRRGIAVFRRLGLAREGLYRPQQGYRRRRDSRHRLCADAGVAVEGSFGRRDDPASSGVQPGTAFRCRIAEHRARGNRRGHERAGCLRACQSHGVCEKGRSHLAQGHPRPCAARCDLPMPGR